MSDLSSSNCPWEYEMIDSNDPRLTAYVLDELDADDRKEVEAAINSIPALAQRVQQLRTASQLLVGSMQSDVDLELTPEQRSAIEEQLDARSAARSLTPSTSSSRRGLIWFVAVAAMLLLAVIIRSSLPSGEISRLVGVVTPDDDGPSANQQSQNNLNADSKSLETRQDAGRDDSDVHFHDKRSREYGDNTRHSTDDEKAEKSVAPALDQPESDRVTASGEDAEPALNPSRTSGAPPAFADLPGQRLGDDTSGATIPNRADPAPRRPNTGKDNQTGDRVEHSGQTERYDDETTSPAPSTGPGRPNVSGASSEPNDANASDNWQRGGAQRVPQLRSPDRPADSSKQVGNVENSRSPATGVSDDEDRLRPSSREGESAAQPEESEELDGDPQERPVDEADKPGGGRERGRHESELKSSETNEERRANQKSWRRAAATPNATRLMVGERDDLPLEGMQVNVKVDGFRARVLLDYYFYNNHNRQLEGAFKLRLPSDASLYYFAFGQTSFEYRPMVDQVATKGFLSADLLRSAGTGPEEILKTRTDTWTNVKEARVVPKEKAAHAYGEVVRRRVDPALVEWSGAGVFNAMVFPLAPNKLHRIVVGYDVNLQRVGDKLVYNFAVPSGVPECMVDFNVAALPGVEAMIEPATQPFTSGGRAYYHWKDPKSESLQLTLKDTGAILLSGEDPNTGKYFASRITPDLPADEKQSGASRAVFLVDTSLSSRPEKFNIWLELLESTLEKNRDSLKEFNVLFFNVESAWWKETFVENTAENTKDLMRYCHTLSLEGATDLHQALTEALSPSWREEKDKSIQADLFLLSDGALTWGEHDINRIARSLSTADAGALFAYNTGLTGTAIGTLDHLARATGGAVFSVVNRNEVEKVAVAHRNRPWRLLDISASGATDLLVAGRPRVIYPGQPLLITGRGTPDGQFVFTVKRGGKKRIVETPVDRIVSSELTARAYGQVAVGQLEDLGAATEEISVAYARHFRVAGQTCSLLMLESEADYKRFQIKPEDDAFVVKSSPTSGLVTRKLDELAQTLGSSKESLTLWLSKLERIPGVQFRIPTSLKLALEQMPESSFDVDAKRLVCKSRAKESLPKKYFTTLEEPRPDYDVVAAEAGRRFRELGAADALCSLSNLVEVNSNDPLVLQDVAFSAIEWKLGRHAYPLLRRVASMRPYQPQVYQAIAQCLASSDRADLAIVYYEIAMAGQWHDRYRDFHRIAGTEYLHLLNRIGRGELKCSVPQFVSARRDSLYEQVGMRKADLVITMMWNTDRTDVDLHVLEPSGEECYYKNRNTQAGGKVTRDVTEGFGPEMYWIQKARHGDYKVMANYYGTDTNRTSVRSKVHVTVYENYGDKKHEKVSRHTVLLSDNKEKRDVATVAIEK